ncbi:endonuclease domain-containing protein [Streptomyces sp. NPDC056944]|uniref:endonuclease domain-containing protein n=1 Tax=Streptomyces sp. NPDC056944 TaxID=3345972 RepID=UPI00363FF743
MRCASGAASTPSPASCPSPLWPGQRTPGSFPGHSRSSSTARRRPTTTSPTRPHAHTPTRPHAHTPTRCKVCATGVTDPGRRAAVSSRGNVLCPACAQATLLSYRQQLDGKPYAKVRENGPPAQDYLCTLCDPPRPAAAWDHCHDHGLIRGPLCAGCNTMEGHGKDFLTLQGSTAHLLRCAHCRTRRTLPTNHQLAALRRHLHLERGTPGCDWPLHMCVTLIDAGSSGFDCTVRCPGERRNRSVSFQLTPEEADRIQARAVEEGLSDPS